MPDGYETLSGAVGRASDLGLEPASQLTPPLHFNFLISDFYVTNLIDRSRLGTPKFWCATEAASSFSVIHRRVPRNFHSASRRWGLEVQGYIKVWKSTALSPVICDTILPWRNG